MIEAESLCRRFGAVSALNEVSLRVSQGEVLCLLGANGAGKTTLINVLMGFVAPTSGRVRVDGIDVRQRPVEARARIGFVPEQVRLYDHLSGLEHLRFFTRLAGQSPGDDTLIQRLADAGLGEADAHRRVSTYSKGMRQKVALAIALARDARTLLLDEPLSGLDPKAALDLSCRLRQLGHDGHAVLLTTHDLLRARETATRIAIMRDGRLVAEVEADRIDGGALESLYLDAMR